MHRIMPSISLACWLLMTYSFPAQAITIDLLPTLQEVDVNTPATVDIAISGLVDSAAPSLSSFDLNIIYDPEMLSFPGLGGVDFGDQLDLFGFGSLRSVDDSVPGIINLFELSLDPPDDLNNFQPSTFTLGTLTFDTLLTGVSTLALSLNALGDANGDPLAADLNGAEINTRPTTDIPEPTILMLFVTGMAGLCWRTLAQPRQS